MDETQATEHLEDNFKRHITESFQRHVVNTGLSSGQSFSSSTRLLQRAQEERLVHKALLKSREEFNATQHIQNIRRKELKQKEIKITERIENADQYIKTMQEKQCQASRRLKKERELRLQKEKELQALKEELQQLSVRRDRLRKRVEKNEVYADFVTGVVKSSNQFQDTRQLISYFDMMTKMKKELLQSTQRTQAAAETTRAQLKQRIDQNSDRILQCNNKLAELQRQLDAALTESQLWDSKWAHIQNTAAKKTLSLGAIKMATMNTYQNVCKKARDEVIAVDDTMKQLDKIQAFFLNQSSVWEEISKVDRRALKP